MPHVVVRQSSVHPHFLHHPRRPEAVRTSFPSDDLYKRLHACVPRRVHRARVAAGKRFLHVGVGVINIIAVVCKISSSTAAVKKPNDEPLASRVLSSILRTSDVPYR